jgi:hypothetical protein
MKKIVGIPMEEDLHDQLKIAAVRERKTITSIVAALIVKYLKGIK